MEDVQMLIVLMLLASTIHVTMVAHVLMVQDVLMLDVK